MMIRRAVFTYNYNAHQQGDGRHPEEQRKQYLLRVNIVPVTEIRELTEFVTGEGGGRGGEIKISLPASEDTE